MAMLELIRESNMRNLGQEVVCLIIIYIFDVRYIGSLANKFLT